MHEQCFAQLIAVALQLALFGIFYKVQVHFIHKVKKCNEYNKYKQVYQYHIHKTFVWVNFCLHSFNF